MDISSSNPEPPVFWVPTMDNETFTEEVAKLYTTVSFTEVPVIRSKASLVLVIRPDCVINAIFTKIEKPLQNYVLLPSQAPQLCAL